MINLSDKLLPYSAPSNPNLTVATFTGIHSSAPGALEKCRAGLEGIQGNDIALCPQACPLLGILLMPVAADKGKSSPLDLAKNLCLPVV